MAVNCRISACRAPLSSGGAAAVGRPSLGNILPGDCSIFQVRNLNPADRPPPTGVSGALSGAELQHGSDHCSGEVSSTPLGGAGGKPDLLRAMGPHCPFRRIAPSSRPSRGADSRGARAPSPHSVPSPVFAGGDAASARETASLPRSTVARAIASSEGSGVASFSRSWAAHPRRTSSGCGAPPKSS